MQSNASQSLATSNARLSTAASLASTAVAAPSPSSAAAEELWKKSEKISADLAVLTHAALVAQVVRDAKGDVAAANAQLDKMGRNAGRRLVEEYVCRAAVPSRSLAAVEEDFGAVVEHVRCAFRVFCGVEATVEAADGAVEGEFFVRLAANPFEDWVDVPRELQPHASNRLAFSQFVCGAVKGALAMLQLSVECEQRDSRLFLLRLLRVVPNELLIDEDGN